MGAQQNEKAVRDFLGSWNDDAEKLGNFFADDAVFQMMAREPVRGRAAIQEELANQAAWATDFDLAVLNLACAGDVVLVERLDRFTMNGARISVPVVGVFECDDAGVFTAWRDYFDWDGMMRQVAAAGIDTGAAETEQLTPAPGRR
ncbi:MAG: nuclear transport factor 2 family protein [Acidimicrobiia bacterium]|nr:nuclear transport factor 2 family protein [Acidimicrobiia bacterium]